MFDVSIDFFWNFYGKLEHFKVGNGHPETTIFFGYFFLEAQIFFEETWHVIDKPYISKQKLSFLKEVTLFVLLGESKESISTTRATLTNFKWKSFSVLNFHICRRKHFMNICNVLLFEKEMQDIGISYIQILASFTPDFGKQIQTVIFIYIKEILLGRRYDELLSI